MISKLNWTNILVYSSTLQFTRCVRKVSDLRSYLRVSAILCHPDRGILRSSPHLIEPHAPSSFHILKQSSNADFGIAFSSRVALLWMVSMSSNRFPFSAIFNFGNIQKSQGAMSGLYGGWRSCTILRFAKNCYTRFDECAGALSWWRSQSPLDPKRGRILLTASCNLFRTST